MHTLLDLHGNIPTFISITEGKVHDVNILDEILPEAGAFYVMDRGYVDFERLYIFTLSAAFFVVRTKSNVLLQRRYSHPVDRTTGVRSDHNVILTAIDSAKAYPEQLRRVSYLDVATRKRFKFLTNNFTLPALTIALIYKSRWQVELFFESSTWRTPLDVMEFQASIALNRPLVGSLDGSVRPRIARRPLCAESRVRSHKPAMQATVSAESAAKQSSA
jgi:IS4 transposase